MRALQKFDWSRKNGYECSSVGDRDYSAFYARLPNGRTVEEIYQCDVKGYSSIQEGKGKPPLTSMSPENLWNAYLNIWREWAKHNSDKLYVLAVLASDNNYTLCDCFANTNINQARALAQLLNEEFS